MQGKVKSYSPQHGYGFIDSEGNDYWFHINQFREINAYPKVGDAIEFDPVTSKKGLRTANMKVKEN